VNSRITFGAELRYAMHVRGLSLTDVARLSGVAVATASSAAMGRPVNVTTALRVARAVAARPIIPELLEWVERPHPSDVGLDRGHRSTRLAPSGSAPPSPVLANEPIGSRRPRRPAASTPGQLRILVD
jgi:transcriptional regulator with XRE-family HTH domain